ncbi:glycosyltransferase family 4 protein [Pedobacter puniceum]|jgi:glycosyltransferase involved in cell wall biosynthesis|uniref:Glycosyltransferase n=1 Tax=Pedobacter puniceum TaxID=2666136 RepID=A0A7K0FN06_9SPHI|nr:glycosyltransferase family 4 protein [Pedobacter puniceum]MRX47303.1 glycosyltransferase [Pedobacter puniceum]
MKVLLLTNRVPFPPNGGYPIVIYNTIRELVELGCEVTLFSLNTTKHFVKTKEIKDPVFKKIKFVQYKIDNRVKVKDAFLNLFTGKSYNLSRFYEKNCASKLAHLLRTQEFDIIQFEGLQVVPYLDIIKEVSKGKLIYRAHNIEHQIWKRLTLQENFFLRKMYFGLLSKRLQKFEFKILNSFDAILAISSVDEHFFKSVGCQSPVHTFPVALNLDNYEVQQQLSLHKSIGYIGSMEWRPNLEGIDWFLEKVWPSIKQLDAGITFHLAGKNMPKYLKVLNSQSFILEGEVEDAAAFMARQHVLIVPLLSGSGMRVKIIEAMALGKCIIATSIAAEGINYQHDVNILIADKADDFYKQILRCFTDKTLISRIGKEAKKLVAKYHDNKTLSKDLLNVYQTICDKKP